MWQLQIENDILLARLACVSDIEAGGDGRPLDNFCSVTLSVVSAYTCMLTGPAQLIAKDIVITARNDFRAEVESALAAERTASDPSCLCAGQMQCLHTAVCQGGQNRFVKAIAAWGRQSGLPAACYVANIIYTAEHVSTTGHVFSSRDVCNSKSLCNSKRVPNPSHAFSTEHVCTPRHAWTRLLSSEFPASPEHDDRIGSCQSSGAP